MFYSLQFIVHSLHYNHCACVLKVCGIFIAGLLKTHNLSFQDSESLQAVFDKDSYANVFRSQPRSVKYFYRLYLHTYIYNIYNERDMTVFLCHSTFVSALPIDLSLVLKMLDF